MARRLIDTRRHFHLTLLTSTLHVDVAVAKHLKPGFSAGSAGSLYWQVDEDGGLISVGMMVSAVARL